MHVLGKWLLIGSTPRTTGIRLRSLMNSGKISACQSQQIACLWAASRKFPLSECFAIAPLTEWRICTYARVVSI